MKAFIFLLLIVIITSCQFIPDDVHYVERSKPESPEVEIIELSLDTDSIFLTDFQNIRFQFSAGKHSIMQVGILIDGEEKYVRSNYRDNFTIKASDLSEGIHKLSFSVITNSNSGSIADLLGYEGFQFISNEWTLVCVKNDRRASFIHKQIENGKLKLSWEEHNKVNFKSYRITKKYDNFAGIVKEFRTTVPYLVDEAYVGETAYYDVYTEYNSSAGYEFHWAEIAFKNSLPLIQIRRNPENGYEIFWENNQFEQAVKNYRLIDLKSPADTVILWQGDPSDDNHFAMAGAVFGNKISYRLVAIPKLPDKLFNNDDLLFHSTSYDGLVGERSFTYTQIAAVGEQELLLLKDNFIYRYSVSKEKLLDSLTYSWTHCGQGYGRFSLSPGRKYFTASESCNNKLVLMQPGNLADYKSYPIDHIITQGMRFNSLPVSDNGIVVAKDYNGVHIYDVLRDELIGSVIFNESVEATGISSLGNYFAIQTSILRFYKITNQKVITVWESNHLYSFIFNSYAYDPEKPDQIILHDGSTLYHKNASDFTTIKSFPLKEENIVNYDFFTRRLLAWSDGYLSVYSIDDGELIFQTKADSRVILLQHSCRLALNTIYLKDGVCIHLPE